MKIPSITIQQLLEAGVHLGHKTLRWNPKMKKYIFGKRDSIHIIDLTQTLELINIALEKVYDVISQNGKILFISTKKQASESIADLAKKTDQYYVNYRWLGGMLTNWGTVSNSIKKLEKLNIDLFSENRGFKKKELLKLLSPNALYDYGPFAWHHGRCCTARGARWCCTARTRSRRIPTIRASSPCPRGSS